LLKELSHLPVIADPSHGTGAASRVEALSLASAAAGADGLIIEVHPQPAKALSDSQQAIDFAQFEQLLGKLNTLLNATGRESDHASSVLKLQSL
jgi:3-deoxy-7-phosphoheptulonate synthase